MKKLIVGIALSVLLLSGCSDDSSEEKNVQPSPTSPSVETTREPGSNSSDAFPRILKKKEDK